MINVCVSRIPNCCVQVDSSCVVGDTISNSLILTETVAGSVARALIDREQEDKEIINATCSLTPYLRPSSLVEASDKEFGIYRGKLLKFSLSIQKQKGGSFSAKSNIEIEKVAK